MAFRCLFTDQDSWRKPKGPQPGWLGTEPEPAGASSLSPSVLNWGDVPWLESFASRA